MHLAKLGQVRWTVLAVLDDRGDCPVLELLSGSGAPGERLLSDMRKSVPERGPPKNTEASKPLRDKIFEFREPTTHGGTLRVLWFYDENQVVVCANGILKKSNKTPDALIDAAIEIRDSYMEAKRRNQIVIEELPTDDDVNEGN